MNLSSFIEHTNLSPTLTIKDIDQLVIDAKQYNFLGICVPPFWVKRVRREMGNENIVLVTVAGFPLGYNMTETKLDEMKRAIDNGADELDVVWNVSSFKTGNPWTKIEIAKCSKLAHDNQKIIKVIIESGVLTDEEIIKCCTLYGVAEVDYLKTSTGYAEKGATVEAVALMRKHLPGHVKIKASGGIKTYEFARQLVDAGASRLGCSASIAIVKANPGFITSNY